MARKAQSPPSQTTETTPNPTAVLTSAPAMSPAVVHRPKESEPATSSRQADAGHFRLPKLRLEIRDLSHDGALHFLTAVNATTTLQTAIRNVLRLLYLEASQSHPPPPPTRSVTLILRSFSGVAYTTGSELDNDHKEIHFSLDYVSKIDHARLADEITGVITHELVHCYQFNARGTCPGGLIEGVADWVRLHADLSPPHWKREATGEWDAGYQQTAFFLDYLEDRFGSGSVRRLNEKLRSHKYEEKAFWTELFGRPVEMLWTDYKEKLASDNGGTGDQGNDTASRTSDHEN